MNIGLWSNFQWVFVIADINNAIIDADFLCHFSMYI